MPHVDHFFTIGQQHVRNGIPCEDYAISGRLSENLVYAALSDGCSGANARTDVGARGWCLAFERRARVYGSEVFNEGFLPALLDDYAAQKWTDNDRDDFASLVAMVATTERADVWIMGDGGYALQHANGEVTLVGFEWEGNAPFYPTYLLQPSFLVNFTDSLIHHPLPVTEERTRWRLDKEGPVLLERSVVHHPFEVFQAGHQVTVNRTTDDVIGVSIFSDGLWALSKTPASIALQDCLAFKNFEGTFVKRRMVKALAQWGITGRLPQDDLATATVRWRT